MMEKTFLWLMTVLLVCATFAFKTELDHFWPITPIPDTNTLSQEHCIKNNGVPINDANGNMLDCRIYKISAIITLTPTPIAGASATPIPYRASSASASNSGVNQ